MDGFGRSVPSVPRGLALWITGLVVAASAAVVVVAASTSLHPDIALPWPGLRPDIAGVAGLMFWLAFGLVGGVRANQRAGGAVTTFSMPFVVAGTLLGGPLAGALMGFVSEFEVREIRTQPWYGVLANHAVSILSALAAAAVAFPVRDALEHLLPSQGPLVFFLVAMVAALVFTTVNVVLVIPVLAFRHKLTLAEAARTPDASFRATAVAEAILAWNLAATYLFVGWWAPLVVVALVLIVWQVYDLGEKLNRDALTGLLNEAGFNPRFASALERTRTGHRSCAYLALDLDRLWWVNLRFGQPGGDAFLRVAAARMKASIRATDAAARRAGTGDEFMLLLVDVADEEAARLVARRIRDAIREPIQVRSTGTTLPRPGAAIGGVFLAGGTSADPAEVARCAEARLKTAKCRDDGEPVWSGDGPTAEEEAEYEARKRSERELGIGAWDESAVP